MPLDAVFDAGLDSGSPRAARGRLAYHAGLAAEDSVARRYERQGLTPLARRWRGSAGEVDLVFCDGAALIFVEVKHSATHAQAAEHLTQAQLQRIIRTGEEFAGHWPDGLNSEMRFDLALVDGQGRIEVIEALMP